MITRQAAVEACPICTYVLAIIRVWKGVLFIASKMETDVVRFATAAFAPAPGAEEAPPLHSGVMISGLILRSTSALLHFCRVVMKHQSSKLGNNK